MLTPEERALITDMKDRLIELYVERIGAARVRVADVGREEFEEAHRGALAGGSDEFGQPALWSGYLQHVRIHDASSGREMRNKGARRAP